MAKSELQLENERLARIGHKRCSKCGQAKPFADFHRWKRGVLYPQCKGCRAPGAIKARRLREQREASPERLARLQHIAEQKELAAAGRRRCSVCGEVKGQDEFKLWGERPTSGGGSRKMLSSDCLECRGASVERVARGRENRTLAALGERRCKVCLQQKPLSEFYRASHGGWQAACKTCYGKPREVVDDDAH